MMGAGTAGVMLRWVRAFALSGVALLTGATAHVAAGGLLPGAGALVLMVAVVTIAAAPLLRREASTVRVVMLLVLAQTAIHAALTALAGHQGSASAASANHDAAAPEAAAHVHAQAPLDSMSWAEHLLSDLTGANAAMAAVHLVAAALVGVWLAAGERAVWTLLALAGRPILVAWDSVLCAAARLGSVLVDTGQHDRTRCVPREDVRAPSHEWLLSRAVTRRGPPPRFSAV